MQEWLSELSIEDLPKAYQGVAEVIGVENAILLSEAFGGLPVYFPKLDSLIALKKRAYIRKNFTGNNHRDLAKKTGYTERWIYDILEKGA